MTLQNIDVLIMVRAIHFVLIIDGLFSFRSFCHPPGWAPNFEALFITQRQPIPSYIYIKQLGL